MEARARARWLATLLNFVAPGSGHLYVGRAVRWFVPMLVVASTIVMFGRFGWLSSLAGYLLASVMVFGLAIFGLVDAFRLAGPCNSCGPKWYSRWYLYVLWLIALLWITHIWQTDRANLLGYATYRIPSAAMAPGVALGDYILVDTWAYNSNPPSAGDVVVVKVPTTGAEHIRRIRRLTSETEIELEADNAAIDPVVRSFPTAAVSGKVTYILLSKELGRIGGRVE
jgi:hypothetical protein